MPDRWKYARRAASVSLAVALATAACGGKNATGAPVPETSDKERAIVDVTPDTAPECGRPFSPPASGVLTLTGRFPTAASTGDKVVTGVVEVTARQAVRGVVSRRAEVFLVRDGRVVTVPMPQDSIGVRWDLAPGKVERLPGEATLVSCEPGGSPVPRGRYDLYARVMIIPDDGPRMTSFGGPWPLEVR